MKQKLRLLMLAALLFATVFSINSVAWPFEKLIPQRIPEDQIVSQPFDGFDKSGDPCEITNDFDYPASYYGTFDAGTGFAVFMNPTQCSESPYPFKVTDVHFYLYDPGGYHWPVAIQVNIRDSNQGDSCSGPQDVLCFEDFSIPSDSAYPNMMTLSLSSYCCVYQPFFLEIIYTEPRDPAHPHPSLLMDTDAYPADTCDNWVLGLISPGIYTEWYDVWTPPTPGDAIIRATGYTNDPDCPAETCWYWKADKPSQEFPAPSGMPDFDQYQFEGDSVALCGPTAVANCLWWFNAVPPGMNPPDFIRLLSDYFHCDVNDTGTYVDSMQLGLDQYFIDYGFNLYEHTYYQPDFPEMEDSLKKCQDIILLLGFYQYMGPGEYLRIGGHFVTMAGVCSESLKVALSDPARDMAVWYQWPGRIRPPEHPAPEYPPTLHNDPTNVSQDMYTSTLESPTPGNPNWGMDYPYSMVRDESPPFLGQNFQPEQEHLRGSYIPGVQVLTEVEYAIMICPGEWYWKPDKPDQTPFPAPSGMPDFDQNQDEWSSYCAPTAVANCLWWYNAVPEGMSPPEFIELLATYFKTDPLGTDIDTLQKYLDQYFDDYGFALQESTYWMPDFHEMEESLKVCQDIILGLGFFWYDGEQWHIDHGHAVTMAGVHSEGRKVALSDPDADAAEYGRTGRVRPDIHPPHPGDPTVHNDPSYVSQDVYDCTLNPEFPSPGNPHWEIDDYITPRKDKYTGKNIPHRFKHYFKPAPKDKPVIWRTEVMAAIMICPKPSNAVEGEEQGGLTPDDFELYQNYPNPFNNETLIKFNLRKSAEVSLVVYNILGQKVQTLVTGRLEAGPQSVSWNGKDEKGNDLSSGIYFYQLKSGELTLTKRLVLLK